MDCYLHKTHSPEPLNSAIHHVLPKSWGGPDTADNKVTICPTGHENTHTALNWFVKYTDPELVPYELRRKCGLSTWLLALRGWEGRGDHTPYTLAAP